MNTIAILCSELPQPGGLWTALINWFHTGIGNFGWTIFLLTIAIRLITSPLDFWTKLNSKKQSLIQQKLAPQIAKIKKKFGNNQQAIRVQTNALQKKEGLNMGVGCLVTLIHLVLSLVIFFTFYGSLRTNSAYQAINQYEILKTTYDDKAYDVLISRAGEIDEYVITNREEADVFVQDYVKGRELANPSTEEQNTDENVANAEGEVELDGENTENTENTEVVTKTDEEYIALYQKYEALMTDVQTEAENVTVEKWNSMKSNWLWIDNIWVADAPTYPFLSYNALVTMAKSGGAAYTTYVEENVNQNEFNAISNLVNSKGERTQNGYYILAILSAGATFLSQFIAEAHNKLKNKKAKTVANATMDPTANMSMKWMKFIMPVIIILFVIRSSASFGIYIVASNISAILLGELISLLVNKMTYKKQKEVEAELEKEANRLIKKGKLQEKK